MNNIDISKVVDVEVDGIRTSDYPDFCDSYISRAYYPIVENPKKPEDYRELTEEELEDININHSDFVYERTIEWVF